jgi:RNA polymerase sigma-70 factor (ECF subfamily)
LFFGKKYAYFLLVFTQSLLPVTIFRAYSSDQDIADGIRTGGSRREHFENRLYYKYRYLIRDGTRKHKIEEEEASIAYSDTILTVIEHIATGRFEGRSELKTYVYQIFSNKCVDVIRKRTTNTVQAFQRVSIDDLLIPVPDSQRTALADLIRQQDHQRIRQLLTVIGERCQGILTLWSEGFSDREIALQYQYNTEGVAQTTRLRCLEKLRVMYKGGE